MGEPYLVIDTFILEAKPNKSYEDLNKVRAVGPDVDGENQSVIIVEFVVPPDFNPTEGACLSFTVSEVVTESITLELVQMDQSISE